MSGGVAKLLRATQLNACPVAYAPILRLQEYLFEQRRLGLIPDTLLQLEVRRCCRHRCHRRLSTVSTSTAQPCECLQHGHVYTMGKRGSLADFHADPEALRASGTEVAAAPRGGETTYHGPGQLVVYPLLNLRELGCGARDYVEGLEDVIVQTLGRYGISARVGAGTCCAADRTVPLVTNSSC
jgi:hypothetical protein